MQNLNMQKFTECTICKNIQIICIYNYYMLGYLKNKK